jgi:hypothetical protein
MSNSVGSNPYAVTTDALVMPGYGSDAEAIRKKHLNHEASVKSIGTLYVLGGVLGLLFSIIYTFAAASALTRSGDGVAAPFLVLMAGVTFGMSVLQIVVARGLSRLMPWARIAATVLSCLGLIAIPIGTIISAYFLYLLQSQKGAMVFSDHYKEVIRATPHIKYKTSIVVWILLGLLVLLFVAIIVAVVGSSR